MSAPLYALLGVTGLGDVGYRFMDDIGAWIGARITALVDETDALDGTYFVAAPTTPANARSVHWNSSGTPAVKATEVFDTLGDIGVNVSEILGVGVMSQLFDAAELALTSNFTFVGGEPQVQLNNISAGGATDLRAAIGLAAADLDTQLAGISTPDQIADEVQTRTIARVALVDLIGPLGIDGSSFDANAIGPGVLDTGAISNVNFAAGAIDAAALAPSASTEIAAQVDATLSAAHGAGAWGAFAGTGAFAITITVDDGAVALQNVSFGIYDGALVVASGLTNALGQATLALNAGTFTVVLVKANHSFAPVSRTVTGNQAGTLVTPLSMAVNSPIVPPIDPTLGLVFGFVRDIEGSVVPNVPVIFKLTPETHDNPTTAGGSVISLDPVIAQTDGTGFVSVELIRTDEVDQHCTYTIICEPADMNVDNIKLESATLDIADL